MILGTVLNYNWWVISNIPYNHAITYTSLESGKRNYCFGKSLEKVFLNFASKNLQVPVILLEGHVILYFF